ncbi:MAG: UDP-glucose 4-epimerase, partial [uncultured Chloroflexi bacterium]
ERTACRRHRRAQADPDHRGSGDGRQRAAALAAEALRLPPAGREAGARRGAGGSTGGGGRGALRDCAGGGGRTRRHRTPGAGAGGTRGHPGAAGTEHVRSRYESHLQRDGGGANRQGSERGVRQHQSRDGAERAGRPGLAAGPACAAGRHLRRGQGIRRGNRAVLCGPDGSARLVHPHRQLQRQGRAGAGLRAGHVALAVAARPGAAGVAVDRGGAHPVWDLLRRLRRRREEVGPDQHARAAGLRAAGRRLAGALPRSIPPRV